MLTLGRFSASAVVTMATGSFVFRWFEASDLDRPWFAVSVNFALMFWVVAVVTIMKPNLKRRYFETAEFETGGGVYEKLGVLWFQSALRLIGWERLRRTAVTKNQANIEKLESDTRSSEFGHSVCFVIVMVIAGLAFWSGEFLGCMWLLLSAIGFHSYPIMLQRFQRPRYRRILAVKRRRNQQSRSSGSHETGTAS